MRINFLFYLDEFNQKRIRPRVLWGSIGFLGGMALMGIVCVAF
jgi:hypothetical protein